MGTQGIEVETRNIFGLTDDNLPKEVDPLIYQLLDTKRAHLDQ